MLTVVTRESVHVTFRLRAPLKSEVAIRSVQPDISVAGGEPTFGHRSTSIHTVEAEASNAAPDSRNLPREPTADLPFPDQLPGPRIADNNVTRYA